MHIKIGGTERLLVELRVDQPSVTTGQYLDYRHFVYTPDAPNNSNSDYTNAWFSTDLAKFNGQTYSALFTQVGIMAQQDKARWFVYSEATVQCLRGSYAWPVWPPYIYLGCMGNFGDLNISPGNQAWTRVEAVTYSGQNWWILRVYDMNGVAYDVAKVFSGSKKIYRANAISEEGYGGSTDPHYLMNFYHYHPEYWKAGSGFTLWPASSGGNNNYLRTSPSGICPTWYGANTYVQGNPHLWQAVSGGPKCAENPLW